MTNEIISQENGYRQCLGMVAASLCLESGYDSAQEVVLETLTEIIQSYITELGNTTRLFCEHSGRTLPNGQDVMCALADVGFKTKHLPEYIRQHHRINSIQISKSTEVSIPPVLQVGKRRNFPIYVSDNFTFPPLPDPHAYIRTTTGQKVSSDYVILRERLSEQRRDVERALTRFVAKTGKSHPLLPHDKNAFPLIAAEPASLPYLAALLPSEHESLNATEVEDRDSNDSGSSKDRKSKSKRGSGDDDAAMSLQEQSSATRRDDLISEQKSVNRNPFLRPVKKPKLKSQKFRKL